MSQEKDVERAGSGEPEDLLTGRILVVDDEKSMRDFLKIALERAGHTVGLADSGEQGLELLSREAFDLVITDLKMREVSGLEVLRRVKQSAPDTEVVVITAYATPDNAIEAMKAGAYDYLKKPFKLGEIMMVCQRALERNSLARDNVKLRRRLAERGRFEDMVGRSPAMQKVFDLVKKIAPTRTNVLITGGSGTGKELVARAIHSLSDRKDAPFMAVNCGAIPSTLLESELFGHVKGAFTGADRSRPGLFRKADGGTLLLDEVSELEVQLQVKLLRVLQERKVRPVGSDKEEAVDVRVIATSNRDLKAEVENNRFREDLFYRLNVIQVVMPSLAERREDIPLLVDHFVQLYSAETGKRVRRVSSSVLKALVHADFPGNVRELENVIERSVALAAGDEVTTEDLVGVNAADAESIVQVESLPADGISLDDVLANAERKLIQKALDRSGGVRTDAAKILGVSFRSLRYRLEKLGMSDPEST